MTKANALKKFKELIDVLKTVEDELTQKKSKTKKSVNSVFKKIEKMIVNEEDIDDFSLTDLQGFAKHNDFKVCKTKKSQIKEILSNYVSDSDSDSDSD
jgi:hypothetical protein